MLPTPPHTATNPRWILLSLQSIKLLDGYRWTATTDVACHLYRRWSLTEPRQHRTPKIVRGLPIRCDILVDFVTHEDQDQQEPGNTKTHTWEYHNWPYCLTQYFLFWGYVAGKLSPSTSGLFEQHWEPIPPYTAITYYDPPYNLTELIVANWDGRIGRHIKQGFRSTTAFNLAAIDIWVLSVLANIHNSSAVLWAHQGQSYPSAPVQYSNPIPLAQLKLSDWNKFTFTPPYPILANSYYGFYVDITPINPFPPDAFTLVAKNPGGYPDGELYETYATPEQWHLTPYDAFFRAYHG